MEDQKTEVYKAMDLGEPVESRYDLPKDPVEGNSRYVRDENAVYAFRDGAWVKEIFKKS